MSYQPPYRSGSSMSASAHSTSGASTSAQSNAASSAPSSSGGPNSAAAPAVRHQEDRLGLTWRTVASSVVLMTQKAEKVAALGENNTTADETARRAAALKELDESVITFLRNRQEWLRITSYLETKLEGKAKEVEVLQNYHASVPRLNGSKRKRE